MCVYMLLFLFLWKTLMWKVIPVHSEDKELLYVLKYCGQSITKVGDLTGQFCFFHGQFCEDE